MSLDLTQFHDTFFEESFEGLDDMENCLLNMDIEGDNGEHINTLFRGAHSIKGGSATFGFMEVADFTHTMETLLDEVRAGDRELTQDNIDLFLESVDCIRSMLSALKNNEKVDKEHVTEIMDKLEQVLEDGAVASGSGDKGGSDEINEDDFEALLDELHGDGMGPGAATSGSSTAPSTKKKSKKRQHETITEDEFDALLDELHGDGMGPSAGTTPKQGYTIRFIPGRDIYKNGNDPVRIMRELEALGSLQTSVHWNDLPSWDNYQPQQCYLKWDLALDTGAPQDLVQEVFAWVEDEAEVYVEAITEPKVEVKTENEIVATSEPEKESPEAAKVAGSDAQDTTSPSPTANPEAAASPSSTAVRRSAASTKSTNIKSKSESSSIRVGIDKVDELINMVGELVITQAMLNEISDNFEAHNIADLLDGLAQLERNSRELQESVMRIRMLPISFAFNRFPRLVRDMSKKLGKKIDLQMTGEGTELDKTVMEKIGDPLVHLVRNAIDHGIEMPDVRKAAGKDEIGTVHLHAYHQGGNIVIEISDDGAGLNAEKLLAKAKEKGVVTGEEELSEEEIHNLIFHPGFSTAEQVSDLSGRGVGMDVVRRNIRSLGGGVELRSKFGSGSVITIRLPLTLAILDGQTVKVGEEIYIISLISIVETIQIDSSAVNMVGGRGEVFRLREEYLPIIRLYNLLNIEPNVTDINEGLIVVVEGEGKRVGLFVDELLGQQQVVIKSLETNYKRVEGVSGATILGDGRVALIMDVPGLIRLAHSMSGIEGALKALKENTNAVA